MSTFHQVIGLWLAPDFSPVERGEMAPPHVNHDNMDSAAIASVLENFNRCGEKVRVRVPDDTIDQVTVHFRMMGRHPGDTRCRDFAEQLLKAATTSRGPTLKIRQRWAGLHALEERDNAPPPVILMFVVEGGFEEVMLWTQQLMMRLRVKAADPMKLMQGNIVDSDYEGHLPKELAQFLETTFGIPYESSCLVDKMASSPLPDWAKDEAGSRSRAG
jgi:hypothetical protein